MKIIHKSKRRNPPPLPPIHKLWPQLKLMRRSQFWLTLDSCILMLVALLLYAAATYDFDHHWAEYRAWEDTILPLDYIVADLNMAEVTMVRRNASADGEYEVMVTGELTLAEVRQVLNQMAAQEVDKVVLYQADLPNGVRYWYKATREELEAVAQLATEQQLPDDSRWYFNSETLTAYTKLSGRLHGLYFRLVQNWMLRHHKAYFDWMNHVSLHYFVVTVIVVGISSCTLVWLHRRCHRFTWAIIEKFAALEVEPPDDWPPEPNYLADYDDDEADSDW